MKGLLCLSLVVFYTLCAADPIHLPLKRRTRTPVISATERAQNLRIKYGMESEDSSVSARGASRPVRRAASNNSISLTNHVFIAAL